MIKYHLRATRSLPYYESCKLAYPVLDDVALPSAIAKDIVTAHCEKHCLVDGDWYVEMWAEDKRFLGIFKVTRVIKTSVKECK